VVSALTIPGVAFAGDGPWTASKSSGCSSVISPHAGGGSGVARLTYDAYRASTRKYVIQYAYSSVDSFKDCWSGYSIDPYKITVIQQFQFNGTSLSCSGGIDASFPREIGISVSCTVSGSTVIEKISTTCSTWQSSCRIDTGYLEVLAASGSSFYNYVYAKTSAYVHDQYGNVANWSTPWI
jgi:hypothetical protein